MKKAYLASIKICFMWRNIYAALEKSTQNIKYRNRCLYFWNLCKELRLVPCSTFNDEDKNFLKIGIAEAYTATTYSGIEKTKKALTDKFKCQSISYIIQEYV